jgi:hypothetical protein
MRHRYTTVVVLGMAALLTGASLWFALAATARS